MSSEEEEWQREQEERARYEAQLEGEARAKYEQYAAEAEAQMEYEKECKDYPLKVIINAIIEQQEKGQLSPQTMNDLKLILNAIEVEKNL